MSVIWTFSQSSEALLQRCIDAAQPPDEKNKWVQKFGLKHEKPKYLDENVIEISQESAEGAHHAPTESIKSELAPVLSMEIDEEVFGAIEAEPAQRFESILEECARNAEFVTKLAEKLSASCIEKICHQVFHQQTLVSDNFIEVFYEKFLPTYLKREQSIASLDLLIQAEKFQPSLFKKLIHILLQDIEIPSKILQQFVQTRTEDKKLELFNDLLEIQLTEEEFAHNLFTIHTLYKEVKKTETIQNYMLSNLVKNGQRCSDEKNFGRLLLAYLQEENNMGKAIDYDKIHKVLEIHRTPFKKPCLNLLKR